MSIPGISKYFKQDGRRIYSMSDFLEPSFNGRRQVADSILCSRTKTFLATKSSFAKTVLIMRGMKNWEWLFVRTNTSGLRAKISEEECSRFECCANCRKEGRGHARYCFHSFCRLDETKLNKIIPDFEGF